MSDYMFLVFFLIVVYVRYHFGLFLCGIWCNKLSEMNVSGIWYLPFLQFTSENVVFVFFFVVDT